MNSATAKLGTFGATLVGRFLQDLFGTGEQPVIEDSDPYEKKAAKLTAMYNKSRHTFLKAARGVFNQRLAREARANDEEYVPVKDMTYVMDALWHGKDVWSEVWCACEKARQADLMVEISRKYPRATFKPREMVICETLEDYETLIALKKEVRALYNRGHNPYVVELAVDTAARMGIPKGKLD